MVKWTSPIPEEVGWPQEEEWWDAGYVLVEENDPRKEPSTQSTTKLVPVIQSRWTSTATRSNYHQVWTQHEGTNQGAEWRLQWEVQTNVWWETWHPITIW